MNFINLLFTFISFILLSSCGNYTKEKFVEESINGNLQEILSPNFSTVKELVLNKRCIECHQQYNSYDSVVVELAAMTSAIESNRMPKTGGALTANQKAIWKSWVDKGAPKESGDAPTPLPTVKLEANWKSISTNITIPKCMICHNPQGQARLLDLSSRQVIFANRNREFFGQKLLDLDNAANSYILNVITDEDEPMPPVWSNINRLNNNEVKIITEWISLGLP